MLNEKIMNTYENICTFFKVENKMMIANLYYNIKLHLLQRANSTFIIK